MRNILREAPNSIRIVTTGKPLFLRLRNMTVRKKKKISIAMPRESQLPSKLRAILLRIKLTQLSPRSHPSLMSMQKPPLMWKSVHPVAENSMRTLTISMLKSVRMCSSRRGKSSIVRKRESLTKSKLLLSRKTLERNRNRRNKWAPRMCQVMIKRSSKGKRFLNGNCNLCSSGML